MTNAGLSYCDGKPQRQAVKESDPSMAGCEDSPDAASCSYRGIHPDPDSGEAREAEAQIVVPVLRTIVVPIGNTAVSGLIVPAAAAIDAVRARGRARRCACSRAYGCVRI